MTRRHAFPQLSVLSVVALLLAACAGTAGESATAGEATASASVSESAAAPESAEASATDDGAAGEGELCAVEFETCPLEAGTYSSDPFEPSFEFTVDDGWTNERAWPDGGGVSKDEGALYWAGGVESGTVGGEEVDVDQGVDGFVAFLQSLEAAGMTVSEPTEVEVDGASGQQVDVDSNGVEAPGLFFLDDDQFNLVPEEKARFIVVDRDGETVVFIVDSFQSAGFDDTIEAVQPVLDSIRWSD